MSTSFDDVQSLLLIQLESSDFASDSTTTMIKNLKTLAEARQILTPDPTPEPEPKGFRAFLSNNSGDLIKVGGTVAAITLIGLVETKFDVIFRSKASKFI